MMTWNGKAVSKVIGWGMISEISIYNIGNEGIDDYRRDRPRSPGVATLRMESGLLSTLHV
jgi:hypothetical protein